MYEFPQQLSHNAQLQVTRAYEEFQLQKKMSQEAEEYQSTINHWKGAAGA